MCACVLAAKTQRSDQPDPTQLAADLNRSVRMTGMRYKLRTLMVMVTIVACGLGWIAAQKRIVDKRQTCARLLYERGDGIVVLADAVKSEHTYKIERNGDQSCRISAVRRWLGDHKAEAILFFGSERIDPSVVHEFPEADVWRTR